MIKQSHLAIACLLVLIGACRTSQQPVAVPKAALPEGEVEIEVACSGPEYFTNGEVFRANSVGESIDLSISKRKAMSNARSQLAASIQTTVKTVTDNYVKSAELNNDEQIEERFESLNREVVNQELRGIRKICERHFKTPDGKYKTYVAIELSAQELVSAYHQRLKSIPGLNIDNDYEKFKKAFETEMLKIDQNN